MPKQAQWIWYPGDFEIHHALKLNTRREERGFGWPAFWRLDDCWHNVLFRRECEFTEATIVTATGTGIGYVEINRKKTPLGVAVPVEVGKVSITVACAKVDGLPAVKVQAGDFSSDESWDVSAMTAEWLPVGTSPLLDPEHEDPESFPFVYASISPIDATLHKTGCLYDFGKQVFAHLDFSDIESEHAIGVYYGESETEALDTEFSYIQDQIPVGAQVYHCPTRAFRYVNIIETDAAYTLDAFSQGIPLETRGAFRCSDDLFNRIWDVAEYTLRLNSQEFFLDGIKRDRWIWSGDAYQSYLVNYYVYFDRDINRRTMIALRGKDPVVQHINTIVDYSLFWFMGLWDHYLHTGDVALIRMLFPRMKTLMDFCLARCDENGFIVGQEGDWTFIDWADLDKDGPVCAEQFLLVRALEAFADCAVLIGESTDGSRERADDLRAKIDAFYWDEEQGAYIDSFTSRTRYISRQSNTFAIILGFVDAARRDVIIERVLENDAIAPITTPYFKFYELDALCRTGKMTDMLNIVRSYWGGMLNLGATTFWEEYDPAQDFPAHYAMYGDKYGKSLCHAWSASPIYLAGRYIMGVRPTGPGYNAFEVAPNPGDLDWFEGVVPLPEGEVRVMVRDGVLSVTATCAGGTLRVKDRGLPLLANETVTVTWN